MTIILGSAANHNAVTYVRYSPGMISVYVVFLN